MLALDDAFKNGDEVAAKRPRVQDQAFLAHGDNLLAKIVNLGFTASVSRHRIDRGGHHQVFTKDVPFPIPFLPRRGNGPRDNLGSTIVAKAKFTRLCVHRRELLQACTAADRTPTADQFVAHDRSAYHQEGELDGFLDDTEAVTRMQKEIATF